MGFSRFSPGHLSMLALLTVLSALVVGLGCRLSPARRQRLLRTMAGAMVVMEFCKDLILGLIGAFSLGYLPLHLCSLAMFICLYAAWHPNSDAAGQLLWSLCFSGGLAALLFPDWTRMPIMHFQSLHSFLYHAMLVQFSLISVISGQAKPRLGRVWKVWVFLLWVALPVYGFNALFHTNYMFLNHPIAGTPLAWCAQLPGGYLLNYGLLVAAILALLNLPFSLCHRIRHRNM